MELSFRSNFKELEKSLSDIANKELPFATARALTNLAKKVKTEEQKALTTVFDRPTPFTQNSVGFRPANKSNLTAEVYVKDIAAAYLEPYEFGGENKLNSRALIKPINYQKNQYGNVSRGAIKRLRSKSNILIGKIKTKGGKEINGVWQRSKPKGQKGKGVGALKLLLVFDDAHEATQHWGYFDRATRIINSGFDKEMGAALAQAIATSKK